jgi:hypothetical protein
VWRSARVAAAGVSGGGGAARRERKGYRRCVHSQATALQVVTTAGQGGGQASICALVSAPKKREATD